jgi:hypothetical protein
MTGTKVRKQLKHPKHYNTFPGMALTSPDPKVAMTTDVWNWLKEIYGDIRGQK